MRRQSPTNPTLRPQARVWLELGGKSVFGDGRARLLKAIHRTGSIKAGADALGMAYRHAWGHVAHIEKRLGMKVVERHTGGARGGGSRLTQDGRRLLRAYKTFRKTLDREMRKMWRAAAAGR